MPDGAVHESLPGNQGSVAGVPESAEPEQDFQFQRRSTALRLGLRGFVSPELHDCRLSFGQRVRP